MRAGQLVAGLDRLVVQELLVDLDDLHGLHADVDVLEEVPLDHHREDRHEGRRRDERLVAQLGGGRFVVVRRIVGLDGAGVLADLFAADHEVSGYSQTIPRMSVFSSHRATPASRWRLRGRRSSSPRWWPTARS